MKSPQILWFFNPTNKVLQAAHKVQSRGIHMLWVGRKDSLLLERKNGHRVLQSSFPDKSRILLSWKHLASNLTSSHLHGLRCHPWKPLPRTVICLWWQQHHPKNTHLSLEWVCQKGSMSSSKAFAACCWLERQKCKQSSQGKVLSLTKSELICAYLPPFLCGLQSTERSLYKRTVLWHLETKRTGFTTFCSSTVYWQLKNGERRKQVLQNNTVSNSNLQKH